MGGLQADDEVENTGVGPGHRREDVEVPLESGPSLVDLRQLVAQNDPGKVVGSPQLELDLCVLGVGLGIPFKDSPGLLEQLPQIRPAPAATGPRPEALAHLPHARRLLDADEVQHLPLGQVKTEAEFVVEFHGRKARMSKDECLKKPE